MNDLFTSLLILLAILAANLPWLTNRRFLIFGSDENKSPFLRLFEWLCLYFVMGGIAFGLEFKSMGDSHTQDWEFYAITACLFMVFAFPGFIYRHDFLKHLKS